MNRKLDSNAQKHQFTKQFHLCTNDPDEIMNGTKPASLDFQSNEIPYFSLSLSFTQSPQARRSFTYDPIFYREAASFTERFPFRRQTIPLGRLELNSSRIDPRRWRSLSRIVAPFVPTFADPFPRIRIVGASRTSFLSSTSYRLSVAGKLPARASKVVVLPPRPSDLFQRWHECSNGERIISDHW